MISIDIRRMAYGEVEILRDVRLNVAEGETLAILGPSGIGKTTLLRIIAGLITDFSGEITGPRRIAMVFQEPTLLPWRSAIQNLTLTAHIAEAEALSSLEEVGLGDKAAHFPGQLSLGQQRRLSLARAFAAKPDLLLLDEPFASLDEATAAAMVDLTARLLSSRRICCLLVTHAAAEAAALADRAVQMEGRPATITGEYRLEKEAGKSSHETAQKLRSALANNSG